MDKKELIKHIEGLITFEQMKIVPDIDRLTELESDVFYLRKADQVIADWAIEQHAIEAEKLCNKSDKVIDHQGLHG